MYYNYDAFIIFHHGLVHCVESLSVCMYVVKDYLNTIIVLYNMMGLCGKIEMYRRLDRNRDERSGAIRQGRPVCYRVEIEEN